MSCWSVEDKNVALERLTETQAYIRSVTMAANEGEPTNALEVVAHLMADVEFLARVVERLVREA